MESVISAFSILIVFRCSLHVKHSKMFLFIIIIIMDGSMPLFYEYPPKLTPIPYHLFPSETTKLLIIHLYRCDFPPMKEEIHSPQRDSGMLNTVTHLSSQHVPQSLVKHLCDSLS